MDEYSIGRYDLKYEAKIVEWFYVQKKWNVYLRSLSVKSCVATSVEEYTLKIFWLYWIIGWVFFLDSWELQQFWLLVFQVLFNGNGVQWNTVLMLASFIQVAFLYLVLDCLNLIFSWKIYKFISFSSVHWWLAWMVSVWSLLSSFWYDRDSQLCLYNVKKEKSS